MLKLGVALCSVLATTAVFGQTTRVWDGGDGTGVDLGAATNWVGDVVPATAGGTVGDYATWDGLVPGNLVLTYNGGMGSGFQQPGVNFILTPNQVGSVQIISPVSASANLAIGNFITNNSSASLQFGNGSANVLNTIWRATPANSPYDPHYFINNSTAPNIIWPNVRMQAGGGNPHTLVFGGSGNWYVTNFLKGWNGPTTTIVKMDSGTMIWSGPSIPAAVGGNTINTPVDIRGGTLILQYPNLLDTQRITNNGTLLEYAAAAPQTLSGPIHGGGLLRISSGTLTLSSGQSDFTGSIELNNTSTLIVGGGENLGVSGPLGVGGTISFNGGTLQFSVNNAFDYSSRFSAAAGQSYKIDTAGRDVTFATGLGSSGATTVKAGAGTLALVGTSSYSGLTTINGGRLLFQGSKTGVGNITVADGAALGVTATGTQVTPGTLALGSSSGATLGFNNVNSISTPLIAAGTLTAAGTITVNVNSGTFAIGQSYPLMTWTTGSAPTVSLGVLTGAGGNLSIVGSTLYLNITSLAFVWTGNTDGNWDSTTAGNWTAGGNPSIFVNGNTALFDDTATGLTDVLVNAPVAPTSTTVNSSSKTYSITSSGANVIGGTGGLTKSGSSTLTLAGGINTYSGPTTISGGTLSVGALANGGVASDVGLSGSAAANLVLDGGTLTYTGGAVSSDRLFTLSTGGGAINSSGFGALELNNSGAIALGGVGARALTLAGSNTEDNRLAAIIGDSGGATALAKSGSGKWVVTGNNTYSGATTIAGGTLQVGAGGATGSLGSGNVAANGSLIFNRTGTLTNSTISGSGSVTVNSGTVVLPGNNTYTGGTTISSGTLQVGTGGATGSLNSGSAIVTDGTIIFDSTSDFSITSVISGTGNLVKRGSGLLKIIGGNTYSGWTVIDPGATLQVSEGQFGALTSSVVTNNGTLLMTRQDTAVFIYGGSIRGSGTVVKDNNNSNVGDVTFTGDNTYTGGTVIGGGNIIVGDGGINGWIVGNVLFTNSTTPNELSRSLVFNRSDDVTFPGLITFAPTLPFGNRGVVVQNGSGTLTLTGNNDYPGGTTVNAGVLQAGNGGTTGAIGTGPVTVNTLLIFNRSDDITFGNTFTGSGSVVKAGAGKLTLTSTNNITGSLIVSNGTLVVNSEDFSSLVNVINGTLGGTGAFYGAVILEAGTTLAPGTSVGTLTFNGNLDIGGNVAVEVDKSLSPSNDVVVVLGTLTKVGTGTLTVANLGSTLVVGDKFTLFSQPVANGAALTVTGGGATWINNLEVDGSITVSTVTAPPTLNFTTTGNSLQFTWTGSFKLQAQTNSLSVGISNNWGDYPGGGTSGVTVPVNVANGSVFFRLAPTP
jgi:fibronectin-binding autotransporter adhesin